MLYTWHNCERKISVQNQYNNNDYFKFTSFPVFPCTLSFYVYFLEQKSALSKEFKLHYFK